MNSNFIQSRLDEVRSLDKNTLFFVQKELESSIEICLVFQRDAEKQNNTSESFRLDGEIRVKKHMIKTIQGWIDGFT